MLRIDRLVLDRRDDPDRGEVDDPLDVERDRGLEHVDDAADVDAEHRRPVGGEDRRIDDRCHVDDLVRTMRAHDVEEAGRVVDRAALEDHLLEALADHEASLRRGFVDVEGDNALTARVEQCPDDVAADETTTACHDHDALGRRPALALPRADRDPPDALLKALRGHEALRHRALLPSLRLRQSVIQAYDPTGFYGGAADAVRALVRAGRAAGGTPSPARRPGRVPAGEHRPPLRPCRTDGGRPPPLRRDPRRRVEHDPGRGLRAGGRGDGGSVRDSLRGEEPNRSRSTSAGEARSRERKEPLRQSWTGSPNPTSSTAGSASACCMRPTARGARIGPGRPAGRSRVSCRSWSAPRRSGTARSTRSSRPTKSSRSTSTMTRLCASPSRATSSRWRTSATGRTARSRPTRPRSPSAIPTRPGKAR